MNATLFMPDISGFTHFVKSTEKEHSQHIIRELLELIIENGKQHFTVAEVEGDAVFFYHEGETYSSEKIDEVVKSIYQSFHLHLSDYEHKRICDCGACRTANDLALKFIVHAGDISLIELQDKKKPFGEPVIRLHRLLKNNVSEKEYILYSCDFLNGNTRPSAESGSIQDADLGTIDYMFTKISDWYEPPTMEARMLSDQKIDLIIKQERVLDSPIDALHSLLVNLNHRHYWNHGVEEVIYDPNEINQVGASHRCIVNGRDLHFDTVRPKDIEDSLSYGEILKNPAPFTFLENDFFLKPEGDGRTLLTMVLRVNFKNGLHRLAAPLFKIGLKKQMNKAFDAIEEALPRFLEEESI